MSTCIETDVICPVASVAAMKEFTHTFGSVLAYVLTPSEKEKEVT
jgi:hypothetical protein